MKHQKTFLPAINGLSRFRPLALSEFGRLTAADERATAHLHSKHAEYLKAKRKTRWPIPCVDEDGTECYLVPLSAEHRDHALVEAADYWAVHELGASGVWNVNPKNGFQYVQTLAAMRDGQPGNKLYIARLILELSGGKKVAYANGNGLDLRRKNIAAVNGHGRRNTANIARRSATERERAAAVGWNAWIGCPV